MVPIKLKDLIKGVGITNNPEADVVDVVTDSRKVTKGSVFVAIVGERLDGNDYVKQAFLLGAIAAVVSRRCDSEIEQIVVNDTKDALIQMSGNYRLKFNPKVVGVTGSVGKTTTKEMLAAIFDSFGNTLKNQGNFNNEIGLPTTIFNMNKETELAVLEMGMCASGEIEKLTLAARPKVAIITAIGLVHIDTLGSIENILKAKLEIVEGLSKDGILVLNGDDEMLLRAKNDLEVDTVTYAVNNLEADVVAKNIMTRAMSTEFTISDRISGSFNAMIPTVGIHNLLDALAAYTAATRIGLDPKRAAEALKNYRPTGMRQNIVYHDGITVIEDCYNANPDSMKAALETLSTMRSKGIKIAVLGDMLTLGEITRDAHKSLGVVAARCGVDVLLCYGENMKYCADAARAAGVICVEHFENKSAVAKYLAKTAHSGDVVLFKASRGLKLEEVIEMFYEIER